MKSRDLHEPIALGGVFKLVGISGNHEEVHASFQEFTDITLDLEVEEGKELTLITFTREQYEGFRAENGDFVTNDWTVNFKLDQLTEGADKDELLKALAENSEAIIDAINEFIDDYEGQNFD